MAWESSHEVLFSESKSAEAPKPQQVLRARKKVRFVKSFTAKPDDPSSVPGTYMLEGAPLPHTSSYIHVHRSIKTNQTIQTLPALVNNVKLYRGERV